MTNLTPGQLVALKEIEEISQASNNSLIIKGKTFPRQKPGQFVVRISYLCNHFERNRKTGLPLHHREVFDLIIPSDFPFSVPKVRTPHQRFNGFPHVQWGNQLCLYLAESTEWRANDGMVGFFERLALWLREGALGNLDPIGGPLHPPMAYPKDNLPGVIPLKNTPSVESTPWIGFGYITYPFSHFCEIRDWAHKLPDSNLQQVAPAFLLADKMPFEFPDRLDQLIKELESRGISRSSFFFSLYLALAQNPDDAPLIILVGAPMRGVSGSDKLSQHLSAWKLIPDSLGLSTLKLGLKALNISLSDDADFANAGTEIERDARKLFDEWAALEETKVIWLPIREARPEVIRPRDEGSLMNWFQGKTIAMWGCGALGSATAEILCRAGVKKLILRDQGSVAPGLLVRQLYDYEDIHTRKCDSLKKRLQRINPNIEIETSHQDILQSPLAQENWTDNADLIVESTGSNTLLQKLELVRQKNPNFRTKILSMTLGHQAEFGMACLSNPQYSGATKDIEGKVKVCASKKLNLKPFSDEFWPNEARTDFFQPEPGCSEPTFVGSAADVLSIVSRILISISKHLACESKDAVALLLHSPKLSERRQEVELCFSPDIVIHDFHQRFEIRCSESAWKEILAWKKKTENLHAASETGGLLFGEYDEACQVFWVSEASGPPPDSIASPIQFKCGVLGVKDLQNYHSETSKGSVRCIGLWHTHPNSTPLPSRIDVEGMKQVIQDTGSKPRHSLLLIVGDEPNSPSIFSAVFSRGDTGLLDLPTTDNIQALPEMRHLSGPSSIGLTLSGGGSRAMAFHLGCLRALYHRGILDRVQVISSISGGSVIGAMFAYSQGSFEEFESSVRSTLRKGLLRSLSRRAIFSPLSIASIFTFLTSGIAAIVMDLLRMGISGISSLFGKTGRTFSRKLVRLQPPFVRWFNRSHALEKTLSQKLFGNKTLSSPRRGDLNVVINATELRTGTAFRFGSRETGASRYQKVETNNVIKVSEAVAASACFPILLPAFDKIFRFKKRDGTSKSERVLLSDGGVYDNLGITPLEPGRSAEHSTNTYQVDYVISCSAGAGIFGGDAIPYWWPTRMIQSFNSTFRRVQEEAMKALHHYLETGKLKGFIFSYLGQIDRRLPYIPPGLIKRETVCEYPTNFSAMAEEDIEAIVTRGEQLTRLLIAHYCPEL